MATKKQRNQYTDEFKESSVQYHLGNGKTLKENSEKIGISNHNLSRWVRDYKANSMTSSELDLHAENERLRKELADSRLENDILKKAAAVFIREK